MGFSSPGEGKPEYEPSRGDPDVPTPKQPDPKLPDVGDPPHLTPPLRDPPPSTPEPTPAQQPPITFGIPNRSQASARAKNLKFLRFLNRTDFPSLSCK